MGCFVSCRISTDKRVSRSLCHSRATCYKCFSRWRKTSRDGDDWMSDGSKFHRSDAASDPANATTDISFSNRAINSWIVLEHQIIDLRLYLPQHLQKWSAKIENDKDGLLHVLIRWALGLSGWIVLLVRPHKASLQGEFTSTRAAIVRRTRSDFGRRAFAVCGTPFKTFFSPTLRTITYHPAFRRAMKTHFYKLALFLVLLYSWFCQLLAMQHVFFYALFLLCQLACFIITVYIGQLLVHFVPCCPVQLLYVKWPCWCVYLFKQINDDDDDDFVLCIDYVKRSWVYFRTNPTINVSSNVMNDRKGHAENVCNGCYCHTKHYIACQAACAAGRWAFIAEQRLRHVYRRAGPCAGCAHRCAGWAWQDMEMWSQLELGLRATGYWLVFAWCCKVSSSQRVSPIYGNSRAIWDHTTWMDTRLSWPSWLRYIAK